MKIRWTPEASANLEGICKHIAENNREVALTTARTMVARIDQLATFPHRGRLGRMQDTRELVFAPLPYIAVYRVSESTVEILSIWHGAQDR